MWPGDSTVSLPCTLRYRFHPQHPYGSPEHCQVLPQTNKTKRCGASGSGNETVTRQGPHVPQLQIHMRPLSLQGHKSATLILMENNEDKGRGKGEKKKFSPISNVRQKPVQVCGNCSELFSLKKFPSGARLLRAGFAVDGSQPSPWSDRPSPWSCLLSSSTFLSVLGSSWQCAKLWAWRSLTEVFRDLHGPGLPQAKHAAPVLPATSAACCSVFLILWLYHSREHPLHSSQGANASFIIPGDCKTSRKRVFRTLPHPPRGKKKTLSLCNQMTGRLFIKSNPVHFQHAFLLEEHQSFT